MPAGEQNSISPDGRWLVNTRAGTFAEPLEGGTPFKIYHSVGGVKWSRDSRFFYLTWIAAAMGVGVGNTYVFPLARGQVFPDIPPGGFPSENDIMKYPGVRVIAAGDVAPGPTPDIYAFSRETSQRNLYRIPLR